MATESSAIVRFIELTRKEMLRKSEPPPLPELDKTNPFNPVRRVPRSVWVVLTIAVLAGLAGAGIVVFGDEPPSPGPSGLNAAGLAVLADGEQPGETALYEAASPEPESEQEDGEPVEPPETTPVPMPAPVLAGAQIVAIDPMDAAQVTENTGFDLRVKPVGARVFLDGEDIGRAPLRVRRIAAGTHVIDIEGPDGYFSRRLEVKLEVDEPQPLRVELVRLEPAEPATATPIVRRLTLPAGKSRRPRPVGVRAPPAAKPEPVPATSTGAFGILRVGAKPPCEIFVNGTPTGKTTPQRSMELPAGRHKLTLVNREHDIRRQVPVQIRPSKTTTVIKDFSDQMLPD